MKTQKKVAAVLVFLILLTGCQTEEAPKQTETILPIAETVRVTEAVPETVPVQTQSLTVQEWLPQEQAMLADFIVIQDGDVRENQNLWQAYLDAVEKKEPASVTVMHYLRTADSEQIRFDLSYDGTLHHLTRTENGVKTEKTYTQLLKEQVVLDEAWEPYDSAIRYLLVNNDSSDVLFEDLIAETDFEGVYVMGLYLKEGEPPLRHAGEPEQVEAILQLLSHAEYLSGDPEGYYYGAKLMMNNSMGKQLVLELDLNRGNYRYGMQTYRYGEVSDLLSLFGLERWPDEVYAEHGFFMN